MKWILPFALAPFGLAQTKPAPLPDFYDPPAYIVSGVTDYTNRGGHGADPVLRSAESLTKAIAALGASSSTASEAELRDALVRAPDSATLHRSLGDREEQANRPIEALHEFERAVELEPSEANLFALASDLLKHHAPEQAAAVFNRGLRLFPRSSRLLLGRAAATYAEGLYEQAREQFFAAVDLDSRNPEPYLFLAKVKAPEIVQSDGFAARMERFARVQPDNAKANYYYALTLIEGSSERAVDFLEKAVKLDPKFGQAWLQLGILFTDAHEDGKAIKAWESAVAATPNLEEAHYRLAQAYRRTGEQAKAVQELAIYQRLSKESAEQLERERSESKRFVFTAPQR